MKPQLACDYDATKLKFPLWSMVKIDGVRGINLNGTLTGRSLKQHKNKFTTARFSGEQFLGMDGELVCGATSSPSLCRDTTSVVNRIEGEPDVHWHLFDYLHPDVVDLPYEQRWAKLKAKVIELDLPYLQVVPYNVVLTPDEVEEIDGHNLAFGYEGTILRDPYGLHKSGRATVKGGSYLRIKRFSDAEAVVLSINEAMQNNNEAKTNELGRTERSSHQENLSAKGMVGSLVCKCCETGETITVGAGDMDHAERKHYFENQQEIVGKIVKYKSFRHGVKDKPRFPTFLSIRAETDIS